MKFTIKRFFAIALLAISCISQVSLSAKEFTQHEQMLTFDAEYCDVEKVLERKLGYILDSTTQEVKEWKAWIEDIILDIPKTVKNAVIIKELEYIKRFSNTKAIGSRLKKNKHLYPTKIVQLLTEKFTETQILDILARRTGKKI